MISYAQNFEDVMLWRAFKNIEKGFYIDIGAHDPVIDSVSLAFYEHGWRGVHVEPVSYYAEKIRNARPDEIVIQAAVGIGSGLLRFFEIAGLSTGNVQIAERHAKDGIEVHETVVPCISLDDILNRYQDRAIHWLKIDVEGMEAEVLQGWHSAVQPWIVVIESTLPNTQIETFKDWEPLVFSLGYEFAYFDGLNRFYVSRNHQGLKAYFNSPPNVFDGFALSGTSGVFCLLLNNKLNQMERELNAQLENDQQEIRRLNKALAEGERELNSASTKIDDLNGHSHHWWTMADNLNKELQAVYASHSWRITSPLRFIRRLVRWFVRGVWAWLTLKPGSRPRRMAKRIMRHFATAIEAKPGLKRRIVKGTRGLGVYPALRRLYRRLAGQRLSPLSVKPTSDMRTRCPEAAPVHLDAHGIATLPSILTQHIRLSSEDPNVALSELAAIIEQSKEAHLLAVGSGTETKDNFYRSPSEGGSS